MCLFRSFCYYKSFLMNKNSKNNNKPGQKTLFQFWKSNSDVTQQQQQQQNADNTIQSAKSNQIQNKPSTFSKNQSDLTSAVSSKTTTNNATNINNTKFSCMKDGDDDEIKFLNELNNENLNEDGVNDEDNNDDDDDLELIETTDRFLNETYKQQNQKETLISEALTVGIEDNMLQCTQHTNTNGFDDDAGAIWIYPTNYPIRDYQYNIVQQCLFKNTMVVLPTGLGKTFVAAVVMFNFYRWYPTGKIMFMAPTRPLVLQQADACYKIMGIPKSDLSQMTGTTSQNDRKVQWSTKRVFFLTPQIVMNDLLKGIVDVNLIKCVVIDEAHKASGDYAFCKVIEAVNKQNKNFRVVALTATPGNDIRAIQNVIQNLLISHIELRSDDSIDIQRYNNSRQVDKYVLKLNSELVQIKDIFMNVMKNPVKRLEISRVFYAKEIASLTKLFVLDRREQFRKNPPAGLDQRRVGMIEGDFAMIISFLHGLELLLLYGIKSFYMFLKSFIDGENNSAQQSRIKNELMNNKDAADMYARLKNTFENSDKSFVVPQNMRHPKLIKLEELVLEHFNGFKGSTRVMIFSQYRESVYEIKEMLSAHEPIIKCMEFVGQSATQGTRKGVTQKEQLNVVKQFRDGGYNTLVSTCVGEEGLDIGEVDLIVCFDSQKSPIRLIQRMGRTGRKREGRIIILLTEGKEEASYNTSLYKKKNIYKTILNSSKTLKFYENNPLMTPKNMKPKCHQMFINTPEEEKPADEATTKKGRKPQQTKLSKAAQKTKVNIEDELDDNPIQTEDTSNQTEPNTSKTKTRKTTKKKENEQTNSKINEKTINSADTSKEMVPNKKQKTSLKMSDFSTEKRASISNDGVANRVKEPPNFDLKCIDKITSETFQEINIHELLEEWKCDEDEFLKFDSQSNNDQSHEESVESIMKKFDDFYQELLASIPPGVTGESEDSEDSDEEMDNEDNQMQIVEEEIVNHSKIESEVNKHGDSYQSIINDTISNENYYNLEFACNNRYEIYKEDANKSPNNAQKNEDENKDDLKINSNKEVFCESKETDNRETNNKFDQFNMFGVDLNDLFGSSESETNNNKNEQNMLGTDLNDLFDSNENESGDTHKNENEGIVFSQKDKKFDNLSLCDELLEQIETSMDIDYDALMAKASQDYRIQQQQKLVGVNRDKETELNEETLNNNDKKSPIVLKQRQNTSTPMRTQEVRKELLIKSIMKSHEKEEKKRHQTVNFNLDTSNVGFTQAMDLLNLSTTSKKSVDNQELIRENGNLDKKCESQGSTVPVFNLNASLNDLFMDENIVTDSIIVETNPIETTSVIELSKKDDINKSTLEPSQDTFYVAKKKVKRLNDLSSSFEETQNQTHNVSNDSSENEVEYEEVISPQIQRPKSRSKPDKDNLTKKAVLNRFKQKLPRSAFIIEEAELDEDEGETVSSDEDDDGDDDEAENDSFIDSSDYSCNETMMYKYHQSLKNARENNNRHFMNRPLRPITDDIFSQAPEQDTSYMVDSFVVADNDYEALKPKSSKSKKKSKISKKPLDSIIDELDEETINSLLNDDDDDDEFIVNKKANVPKREAKVTKSKYNRIKRIVEEDTIAEENEHVEEKPKKSQSKQKNLIVDDDSDDDDIKYLRSVNLSSQQQTNKTSASEICILDDDTQDFMLIQQEMKASKLKTNKNKNIANEEPAQQTSKQASKINWIIADTSQLTSASDIIQTIRKNSNEYRLIIETNINCDFILSQRSVLFRFTCSDICFQPNKDSIIEKVKNSRYYYQKIYVLIEDDKDYLTKPHSQHFDFMIASLSAEASIHYSKYKSFDCSKLILEFIKSEADMGFGINIDCNYLITKKNEDMMFYKELPEVSFINALYFANNYKTKADLFSSNADEIRMNGKMSDKRAKKLYSFLQM